MERRVVNIHTGKSVLKEHDLKEIKKGRQTVLHEHCDLKNVEGHAISFYILDTVKKCSFLVTVQLLNYKVAIH